MTRIDWQLFCGDHGGQRSRAAWVFDKPFFLNGHLYATDGCIAIRAPRKRGPRCKGTPPPVEKLSWRHAKLKRWAPLPEPPVLQQIAGRWFAPQTLTRIATLPNVRYSPTGKYPRALLFAFDGGEGMVMPIEDKPEDQT